MAKNASSKSESSPRRGPLGRMLWLLAAGIFATLKEPAGATEGGGNALDKAIESLSLLKTDRTFRHFVITRALLLSTALSMPYYVVLANEQTDASLTGLGLLFVASGLGGAISAPIWGRRRADFGSGRGGFWRPPA